MITWLNDPLAPLGAVTAIPTGDNRATILRPQATEIAAAEIAAEVRAIVLATEIPATELVRELPATELAIETPATELVAETPATELATETVAGAIVAPKADNNAFVITAINFQAAYLQDDPHA